MKQEIKTIVGLSIPICIGQLGQMLMSVTDNVMVGKLGADALAAASLSNALFMLVMVVAFGVSVAVTPLTAMAFGAKDYCRCGVVLRQGIVVNMIFGVLFCGFTFILAGWIKYMNQPDVIIAPAVTYLEVLGLSLLPIMLFQSFRQFAEGVQFLKPVMIITLAANIVNILANWLFIYGNLGMPALGVTGAGVATICSRAFMAVALIVVILASRDMERFNPSLLKWEFDWSVIKKLLAIGIPAGGQYFFEVSAFSASSIMIGWMGAVELASHQVALSLASISFMVALGISAASTVRVGNAVGQNDLPAARKAGVGAAMLCASFMACAGAVFIIFRHILPTFYVDDAEVIRVSSVLLIIVAFFQVSDGTQAVGLGMLRGITDMKLPTLFTLAAYWVAGLPSGYFLAFHMDLGIYGIWWGLLISLSVSAVLMMIRFHLKTR